MISFFSEKEDPAMQLLVIPEIIRVEFISYILFGLTLRGGCFLHYRDFYDSRDLTLTSLIINNILVVKLIIGYFSGCLGYPSRIDPMCFFDAC